MKKLLNERFQELAGIKPLYVHEQKPVGGERDPDDLKKAPPKDPLLHRNVKVQYCENGELGAVNQGSRTQCMLIGGNTPQVGDWFQDIVGTTAQLHRIGRVHTVFPENSTSTQYGCNPSNTRYNHKPWQPRSCSKKSSNTSSAE